MASSQSGQWYALAKGTVLRDYTTESVLGQGGFGIVYRARHNEVGHLVAIKEFLPAGLVVRVRDKIMPMSEDRAAHHEYDLRRYRDDAKALIKLNRPGNTVVFMDSSRAIETPYVVMEFMNRPPLAGVLSRYESEECPFEALDAVAIAVPVAEGAVPIHRHKVISQHGKLARGSSR